MMRALSVFLLLCLLVVSVALPITVLAEQSHSHSQAHALDTPHTHSTVSSDDSSLLEHAVGAEAEAEAEVDVEGEAESDSNELNGEVFSGVVEDTPSGNPIQLTDDESVTRKSKRKGAKKPVEKYVTKKGETLYRTYIVDPKKHLMPPPPKPELRHSKERVLTGGQAHKLTREPQLVEHTPDRYGWHGSQPQAQAAAVPAPAAQAAPAPQTLPVVPVAQPAAAAAAVATPAQPRSLAQTASSATVNTDAAATTDAAAAAPQTAPAVQTGGVWYAPASHEPAEYALAFAGATLKDGKFVIQQTNPAPAPPTPQFKLPNGQIAIPDQPQVVSAIKKQVVSPFNKQPHAIFTTHKLRHHLTLKHPLPTAQSAAAALLRHPRPSARQQAEVSALRAASRTLRRINQKRREYKRALRSLRSARNRVQRQIHRVHVVRAIRSRKRADRLARRAAWSALLQQRRFRRALRKKLAKAFANNNLDAAQRRRAIVHLLKEAVSEKDRKTLHTYLKHLKGRHAILKRVALRSPKRRSSQRAGKKGSKGKGKRSLRRALKRAYKKVSKKARRAAKKATRVAKKAKRVSAKARKAARQAGRGKGKGKGKKVSKSKKAGKQGKKAKGACKGKKGKRCPKYRQRKPKRAGKKAKKAGKGGRGKKNRRPLSASEEQAAVAELLRRIKKAVRESLPKDTHPAVVKKVKSKVLKARPLSAAEKRAQRRAEKAELARKIAEAKRKIKSVAKFGRRGGKKKSDKSVASKARFQQVESESASAVEAATGAVLDGSLEAEAIEALSADTELDLGDDFLTRTEAEVEAVADQTDDFFNEHGIPL